MIHEFLMQNKVLSVLIGLVAIVGLVVLIYQATAKTVTFSISQPDSTLTLNGKAYELDGNGLTLRLRSKDYQVHVEKVGFEPYDQVIHPETDQVVKVALRVKLSDELTRVLPKGINQGGYEYKVREPTYFMNGAWAVAEVVQFQDSDPDLDKLYAVFNKTTNGWKLIAGPASEFVDEPIEKIMPDNVLKYLESKL